VSAEESVVVDALVQVTDGLLDQVVYVTRFHGDGLL
jgi:hypothetical protein